jgi:hypothetical protein
VRRALLVVAVLLLGAGAVAGMSGAGSLGAMWFRASPGSLNATQAGIQRYLAPAIWTDAVVPVLRQPAWLVAATSGGALGLAAMLWPRR